jgi:hypothetical protein
MTWPVPFPSFDGDLSMTQSRSFFSLARKHHPRRLVPALECLEERRLLSITFSGPNNSGIATVSGEPGQNEFEVRLKNADATTIEFSDNGGASFVDAALSGITGVVVTGSPGKDTLVIDESNGLVGQATSLPITFNGGPGHDILVLEGNAGVPVTETVTAGSTMGASTVATATATASATITLNHVSSIKDTMTAVTLTVNGNNNNSIIHIKNGSNAHDVRINTISIHNTSDVNGNLDDGGNDQGMQGDGEDDDSDGAIVSIGFANKTNVVVNGGSGGNLFLLTVEQPADGLQTLTLNGGAGTNVLAGHLPPATVQVTLNNIQTQVADADDVLIEEMFEERLGRAASMNEVQEWLNVMQALGPAAVIRGIEESPEARTHLVQGWYLHFLGRAAGNGEEQGFVKLMLLGETEEQVLADILASPEFYARAQTLISSGTPDERWVQALYQVLLGRTASSTEVNGWITALATESRTTVALAFVESEEFRIDTITAFYITLLRRDPDDSGLMSWVLSGMDLEHVREGFESSAEFIGDA